MKIILPLILAVAVLGTLVERASGAIRIEVADGANGLEYTYSGTLDTDSLTSWHNPSTSGWAELYLSGGDFMTFYPSGAGAVKGGTDASLVIANWWFSSSLSAGGYSVLDQTGDAFGIQYSDHSIIVPNAYVSGDSLSGSGTIAGLSLEQLKPFDGWVGSPTSGTIATLPGGDTIKLYVVPEPATSVLWFSGAALLLSGRRRKK